MNILKCTKDFELNRNLYAIKRPAPAAEQAGKKPEAKKAPEKLDRKAAIELAKKFDGMISKQIARVEEAFGKPSKKAPYKTLPYKLNRNDLVRLSGQELSKKYVKIPARILMAVSEMASIQAGLRRASRTPWKIRGAEILAASSRLDELNAHLEKEDDRHLKSKGSDPGSMYLGFGVNREEYTLRADRAFASEKERVSARFERNKGGESKEKPTGIANLAADYSLVKKQYEALSAHNMKGLLNRGIIILPEGVDPKSPQAKRLVTQRKAELRKEIGRLELRIRRVARNLDKGKYHYEGNTIIQRSKDGQKYMVVINEGGQFNTADVSYIGKAKASDFNLNSHQVVRRLREGLAS